MKDLTLEELPMLLEQPFSTAYYYGIVYASLAERIGAAKRNHKATR